MLILPFSYCLTTTPEKHVNIRITPYPIAIIAVFAFIATSHAGFHSEQLCFKEPSINYYIKYNSTDSLVQDLKNIGYDVKFSRFGVADININDWEEYSIIIEDYNSIHKAVKVSLGCCIYFWQSPVLTQPPKKQRQSTKQSFEKLVLGKLPSKKTWIVQDNYGK